MLGDGLGPASSLIFGADQVFAMIATLISVDAHFFLVLIDNWL